MAELNRKLDLATVRQTGNLEFLSRQVVEGFITGLHKSPYHGFSVEFAEHKIYNPGESTRHVDWKLYSRTDRLFTKRYEEETNLRCQILLDTSASMYYPAADTGKLTFSSLAAASLIYLLQKQRDAVGLTLFGEEIQFQSQVRSSGSHGHKLFSVLENVLNSQPQLQSTQIAKQLHQIADQMNKRALVVLFSDMFEAGPEEELFSALQHLKHNKHEVLLFHVTDKLTELDLALDDRPYQFIDLETGEKLKLNPLQVRETYQSQMAAYLQGIKQRCTQYRIDFVEADIRRPVDQILQAWLVKRAKMR